MTWRSCQEIRKALSTLHDAECSQEYEYLYSLGPTNKFMQFVFSLLQYVNVAVIPVCMQFPKLNYEVH